METLFRSNTIELYHVNETKLTLVLYRTPRLAKKLNLALKYYPISTTFDIDDEVKFTFDADQLTKINNILNLEF